MREMVVSRYKEDVSWASSLAIKHGYDLTIYNKFEGDNRLPNVGFEAHTYLHHIIQRYYSLSNLTVFCQGRMFDHVSVGRFEKLLANPDYENYISFSNDLFCEFNGCPHHCSLKIDFIWNSIFDDPIPRKLKFARGAIFSVPSIVIKKRPIAFYERAIGLVKNKQDACVMERLWSTIFFNPLTISFV